MSCGLQSVGDALPDVDLLIKDDVAECAPSFHDHLHSTVSTRQEEHSTRKMYLSFIRMTFIKEGV